MGDTGSSAFDVRAYASAVSNLETDELDRALQILLQAWDRGATVFLCGNGGSASSASHFATDLMKTAIPAGARALRAIALGDNPALLTALANDIGYDEVFAQPLRTLANAGDVLVTISASGNSPNILAALQAAAVCGVESIALTGFSGGGSRDLADVAVHVPVSDYGIVETAHCAATHLLTFGLRDRIAQRLER